ncbi:MAG: putative transport system ATP-binding protein [Gaiellaceae bacterium]|nr:putative transport system ATP-binding protein [Gaiellaceae bacterium]
MEVTSLYREPPREQERATAAVEFLDVFKIFRSGPAETVALRGLDLRIEAGEFVAVLGPSGSGKSTFLSLAAGLEQPSAGEVRIFGQPLDRLDEIGLAAFRARRLAIIFQSENLLPLLTARENVSTAVRLGGKPNARARATSALETVDIGQRATHRPAQLSGGEQQRVAVAAALARDAALVLADEPTGELDLRNEQRILDELRRLRDELGSTVVTVTHSPRLAASADRVIEIRDGRVA